MPSHPYQQPLTVRLPGEGEGPDDKLCLRAPNFSVTPLMKLHFKVSRRSMTITT